ncbi:DUF4419 domain-containing protein [Kutzneria kofuensis]|uniref:DUF4419 domain-containing protein n=1 Tax=Kutzneria kofuensis TaxID=103725 RepID=A0A7W9KBG4_9PSEU|nr:DUF4419 domain-containing protein [Kutzneria kofuensis]MBB5889532.1 hypothetical protein [Kutzneria kofuensis]
MTTFRVDDVTPAAAPLPTRPLAEVYGDVLALGGDPDTPLIEPDGVHPLLGAVARAFVDHRPLVLSPDAVWLTIAQGVAQHIRLNAEELRSKLVGHAGREALTVEVYGPAPADADSWHDIVEQFGKQIASRAVGADLFECDFTTSTKVERTAGRVVMLDGYSPYFSYWLLCICGIPSITLTGTVEDWRKIRSRVDRLPEFGLEQWRRSLVPIADEFVRAASGRADTAFWQRIYNPSDAYGGEVITGWAARFYPYLKDGGVADNPNPLLALPIGEPSDVRVTARGGVECPAIRSDQVPATLSRALVWINDRFTGRNWSVALHAGLVGVAQDDNGALRPIAGWHLTEATAQITSVLDRIIRDHEATEPVEVIHWAASAEVMELYRRIGSASLLDGAARIVPAADQRKAFGKPDQRRLEGVVELADGRTVAVAVGDEDFHWVLCRFEPDTEDERPNRWQLAGRRSEVPVLGTSLAMVLDVILDGEDPARLEIGRLADLDSGGL